MRGEGTHPKNVFIFSLFIFILICLFIFSYHFFTTILYCPLRIILLFLFISPFYIPIIFHFSFSFF